jgi:hypothetical protein
MIHIGSTWNADLYDVRMPRTGKENDNKKIENYAL